MLKCLRFSLFGHTCSKVTLEGIIIFYIEQIHLLYLVGIHILVVLLPHPFEFCPPSLSHQHGERHRFRVFGSSEEARAPFSVSHCCKEKRQHFFLGAFWRSTKSQREQIKPPGGCLCLQNAEFYSISLPVDSE